MTGGAARARAIVGLGLSIAGIGIAKAGRPLDTDDAAMLPTGACQVETFVRRFRTADGVEAGDRTRDMGFAPSCNPFGWGEMLVGVGRSGIGGDASGTQAVLQFKRIPVQVTSDRPGFGYTVSLEQDYVRGLARPAARFSEINLVGSAPLFRSVQVDFNAGWIHAFPPTTRDREHLFAGLAAEWVVSPRISLVAERTTIVTVGRTAQIGATLAATPRLVFDVAVGRRDLPANRAVYVTVGLTLASRSAAVSAPTPPDAP